MNGSLRVDVMESQCMIIFINYLGGDLFRDDLIKDGGLGEIDGRIHSFFGGHGTYNLRSAGVGERFLEGREGGDERGGCGAKKEAKSVRDEGRH